MRVLLEIDEREYEGWPPPCRLVTEDGQPIEGVKITDVRFDATGVQVRFIVKTKLFGITPLKGGGE